MITEELFRICSAGGDRAGDFREGSDGSRGYSEVSSGNGD